MTTSITADQIVRNMDQMRTERLELNRQLEECAALACPEKLGMLFDGGNKDSDRRPAKIIIDTVSEANSILARGLYSNLTPPGAQWFKISCRDKKLSEIEEVKTWFNKSSETLFMLLADSNFNMEICEAFEDLGWAGFVNMYVEPDAVRKFRFCNLHVSEFYCQENAQKEIDTVYREFKLTARQLVEMFGAEGDTIPKKIAELAASTDFAKQTQQFSVIHAVYPNRERQRDSNGNPLPDNKNKAFRSIYVCRDEKAIIRESGYDDNPHTVARFEKKSKSIYGFSPCRRIRRTAMTMNKVWWTVLKMGDKLVDPPVMMDAAAYRGLTPQFFQNPGAVNMYDSSAAGGNGKPEFLQIPSQLPYGIEILNLLKNDIEKAYFVNLFQMLQQLYEQSKTQRTAYEVMQLVAEKMAMVIPVVGRLLEELLGPIILKCWRIAYRAGAFGQCPVVGLNKEPLPADLLPVDVSFDSPLALAAKQAVSKGVMDGINALASVAQLDGGACFDYIDTDKLAGMVLDIYAVSPDLIRSETKVQDIRKIRQEAAAQQQQQAMLLEAAKSQNLTGPIDPQSAAARLLPGGLTGGK